MNYKLDTQLATDTIFITDLTLCQMLLMNDANYPWIILVPKRANIEEIYQLDLADQQQLIQEINQTAKKLSTCFKADKINIAALGNIVSQLHIHIIVRYKTDIAWPKPVWGAANRIPYTPIESTTIINKIIKDNL